MFTSLGDRVGYVAGGTNVGIIRVDDRRVLLIDSGLNDTIARKVLRVVRDDLGSDVVAIFNTHAHADHFGANAFIRRRTGCETWAPAIESTVIAHPILQPALLYGGADPMDALRGRFLLAESSPVERVVDRGPLDVHGVEVELVPLAGHSPNQMGVLVDGVFFCADVVFPEVAIEKYRIPYLYGLTDHLASLERAIAVPASAVVPGHGTHVTSIEPLVERNREAIDRTLQATINALGEPLTTDDVCTAVFTALDVPVTDVQGFFLLRPTISAYLAHLERLGEIEFEVDRRRGLWRRR